jgi:hypothetical protein
MATVSIRHLPILRFQVPQPELPGFGIVWYASKKSVSNSYTFASSVEFAWNLLLFFLVRICGLGAAQAQ